MAKALQQPTFNFLCIVFLKQNIGLSFKTCVQKLKIITIFQYFDRLGEENMTFSILLLLHCKKKMLDI